MSNERLSNLLQKVIAGEDCRGQKVEKLWGKLMALSVKNDVQIPFMEKAAACFDKAPSEFTNAGKEIQARYMTYWNTAKEVGKLLSGAAIPWLLLKTRPYKFCGWDINILVKGEYWQKAKKLLVDEGWVPLTFKNSPLSFWYWYEPDKVSFRKKGKTPVHLHRNVSWNRSCYIAPHFVWEKTCQREIEGMVFNVAAPHLDILVHAAHGLFEGFRLKLGDYISIREAYKKDDEGAIIAIARDSGWGKGLSSLLKIINSQKEMEFPWRYGFRFLAGKWLERFLYHARRGRVFGGISELMQCVAFFTYGTIKR